MSIKDLVVVPPPPTAAAVVDVVHVDLVVVVSLQEIPWVPRSQELHFQFDGTLRLVLIVGYYHRYETWTRGIVSIRMVFVAKDRCFS